MTDESKPFRPPTNTQLSIHVRGVLEAVSTGPDEGTYIKIRMTTEDAVKLTEGGAFGRIVQVVFG